MTNPTPGPQRGPILVVDADPSVRRILRLVLEGAGYACLGCSTTEEAEAIVAEHRPKFVLVEVRLDGENGGQDLARAFARSGGWRPRVALMSAYPRPKPGYEDYFLPKPIEFDRLLQLLDATELEPGW